MNFAQALELCLMGRRIRRKGWNCIEQCVIVGTNLYYDDHKGNRQQITHLDGGSKALIFHGNRGTQIWSPSQSDLLSEDWEVV